MPLEWRAAAAAAAAAATAAAAYPSWLWCRRPRAPPSHRCTAAWHASRRSRRRQGSALCLHHPRHTLPCACTTHGIRCLVLAPPRHALPCACTAQACAALCLHHPGMRCPVLAPPRHALPCACTTQGMRYPVLAPPTACFNGAVTKSEWAHTACFSCAVATRFGPRDILERCCHQDRVGPSPAPGDSEPHPAPCPGLAPTLSTLTPASLSRPPPHFLPPSIFLSLCATCKTPWRRRGGAETGGQWRSGGAEVAQGLSELEASPAGIAGTPTRHPATHQVFSPTMPLCFPHTDAAAAGGAGGVAARGGGARGAAQRWRGAAGGAAWCGCNGPAARNKPAGLKA
eukprot:352511-Chlamydomonas_euryale.AAC.1